MAAFSLEDAHKTWQRVDAALANEKPWIVAQFRALKSALAQDYSNPKLQFFAFTGAQSVAAGGTVLGTGIAKVVGMFVKKTGTGTGNATDAAIKLFDDATDDTGAADGVLALELLVAADRRIYTDAEGVSLAAGLVVTGHTNMVGSTDSAAGDGGPGFVLIK